MSFIMFTSRFGIFLTVISYVLHGNNITAEKVFVITSYYMILRQTMTVFFPQGIAQLAEAHVALTRIERFMFLEETEIGDPTPLDVDWKLKPDRYNTKESYNPTQPVEISIKYAYAKYGDEVCLKNIVLEVQPRTHIAIIGQVGCGKTCLLNLILGELLPYEGTCKTNGVIAYAAQEPWLFAGKETLKDNVSLQCKILVYISSILFLNDDCISKPHLHFKSIFKFIGRIVFNFDRSWWS